MVELVLTVLIVVMVAGFMTNGLERRELTAKDLEWLREYERDSKDPKLWAERQRRLRDGSKW